ncbi:MAG: four helix bundle protein [Planctomycetota bacterium]
MSEIRSHRDLVAWQKAVELGLAIYSLTKSFPDNERFGLVSQLRRAGVSVASNIAEGYGRGSTTDYVRFLRMARGSLYEIDTQLLIAHRLEYLPENTFQKAELQLNECSRVLVGLIKSLEPKPES